MKEDQVNHSSLRNLPSMHQLMEEPKLADSIQALGRSAVLNAARSTLADARAEILAGTANVDQAELIARIERVLASRPLPFSRVVNATGVLLHTNLGRAPIAQAAWAAMLETQGYCDLEFDLDTGKRASRLRGVEEPLAKLAGSESAMAVNNCAAALVLTITALAQKKPTAVSRGHLVEIGGGFRLPTIMEASGSPLLEIGTTNRTHLRDYEEAIDRGAGLLLLVHRSNFVIDGYVAEPAIEDVVELGRSRGVPVVLDLGSGCLLNVSDYAPTTELTVPQAVKQGLDAVVFSGDKLLGGPQAGLIVGNTETLQTIRKDPLARVVRCDKVQLAGIIATLELYLRGEANTQIPIWTALATPTETLRERASQWRDAIGTGEVIDTADAIGGGSLPGNDVPGIALALTTDDPDGLMARLRSHEPPVIAHIVRDQVLLHPRTVAQADEPHLIAALKAALNSTSSS